MTDNSYATSLESLQSDMASRVTSIMTLNKQQRAEDRKLYEDQEADREAQCKVVDDKQDAERRDDLRRMEKLEERSGTTANAMLQLMQQMCQGNGLQVQQPPSQVIATEPIVVPPQPQQPIRNRTGDMIESLNQIKLGEATGLAKKAKQGHQMDYEKDHPKLTVPPAIANTNANPMQQPPPGGRQ